MSNKNTNRGADCGWQDRLTARKVGELLEELGVEPGGVDYGKARTFEGDLDSVLGRIKELLMAKNAAYGDAALNPLRFHSSASPVEQLNVRMDDKLSRMARGGKSDEDEPLDYVGYWVLREIAKLREAGIRP